MQRDIDSEGEDGMRVLVRVPATVANLGPGFDVMAMALDIYNYLCVEAPEEGTAERGARSSGEGIGVAARAVVGQPAGPPGEANSGDVGLRRVSFDIRGEGSSILPLDQSNLIYRAMTEVSRLARKPLPRTLFITAENGIPLARGLGSSAGAIVGGAFAANELLGRPFGRAQLLEIAAEMEGHPDNVAAALFGGIVVVVRRDDRGVSTGGGTGRRPTGASASSNGDKPWQATFECLSLPAPALRAILLIPEVEVLTEEARRVLPTFVPMRDVVFSLGRAAMLAGSLGLRDASRLWLAMEDRVHEPYRLSLVPGLREAWDSLKKMRAAGVAVAGSGPTLLALVEPGRDAEKLIEAASECFRRHGIGVRVLETRPCAEGVRATVDAGSSAAAGSARPARDGLASGAKVEWDFATAFRRRRILVQKFGGTSVATTERIKHITRHILRARSQGYSPVVVVSAMGDSTDDLIALGNQVTDNPSPREMDMLLATGEQVSAALLAMALQAKGCPAISLTGAQAGIMTDGVFSRAAITAVDPARIYAALDEGLVPVITGFQGVTPDGEITTLGRGGSDTSAVAIAAALGAEECEIYTDVDGVYTADPRVVPGARKLDEVSYDEMAEMAGLGARVLQHRSVEIARAYRTRVRVRNSFSDSEGTVLREGEELREGFVIRSIAHSTDEARIVVEGVPDVPGMAAKIMRALADRNVKVDAIIQASRRDGVNDVAFTVPKTDVDAAREAALEAARRIGARDVKCESGLAKVSVVGSGVCQDATVAAIMFETLGDLGINIEMISTSATRISVIVNQDRAEEAARALHARFGLNNPGGT